MSNFNFNFNWDDVEKNLSNEHAIIKEAMQSKCMFCKTEEAIASHTITKSLFKNYLRPLNKHIPFYDKEEKNVSFSSEKVSFDKASTANLFCNKHDSSLFSPFEQVHGKDKNYEFEETTKMLEIFILGYRVLAFGVYQQLYAIYKDNFYYQFGKLHKKPIITDDYLNALINSHKKFLLPHQKELDKYNQILEDILLIKNTNNDIKFNLNLNNELIDEIKYYLIEFDLQSDRSHNFAFANTIYDENINGLITLQIFPINNQKGYILLQWISSNNNNNWAQNIIQSYLSEDDPTILELNLLILCAKLTNVFYRDSWNEKIKLQEIRALALNKKDSEIRENLFNKKRDYPTEFGNWKNIKIDTNFDTK